MFRYLNSFFIRSVFIYFNIFFLFHIECMQNKLIEMQNKNEIKVNNEYKIKNENYKLVNNNLGNKLKLKGGDIDCCIEEEKLFILNYVFAGISFSLLTPGIVFLSLYFSKQKTNDDNINNDKYINLFECNNSSFAKCKYKSIISKLNNTLFNSGVDYCLGSRHSNDYLYNYEINNDENCILGSSSIYIPVSIINKEDNNSTNNDNDDIYNTENIFSNTNISHLKILDSPKYNKLNEVYNLFNNLENLKYIDITGLDINNVQFIYRMFNNLNNTVVVGFNKLNFENVIHIEELFYNSKIINSNISMIEFNKLKNIENLFYNSSFENVEFNNLYFPIATYFYSIFKYSELKEVKMNNLNLNLTEEIHELFKSSNFDDFSLVNIDLNNTILIDGLFINSYLNNVKIYNITLGSLKYAKNLFKNSFINNLDFIIDAEKLNDISSIFEGSNISNINITINSKKINKLANSFMNTTAETINIYGLSTTEDAVVENLILGSDKLKNISFDSNNSAIENELLNNNFTCESTDYNRTLCIKNE